MSRKLSSIYVLLHRELFPYHQYKLIVLCNPSITRSCPRSHCIITGYSYYYVTLLPKAHSALEKNNGCKWSNIQRAPAVLKRDLRILAQNFEEYLSPHFVTGFCNFSFLKSFHIHSFCHHSIRIKQMSKLSKSVGKVSKCICVSLGNLKKLSKGIFEW